MRYVYLGGPITGQTFDEAADWRDGFDINLSIADCDWQVLSPMRGKEQFRMKGALPSTFDEGRAAVLRDLYDIGRSDAVLVNLHGATRVSIGTMCELGYAYALGKFTLVVMHPMNVVHDHVFVHELASQIVPDLDAALDVLRVL